MRKISDIIELIRIHFKLKTETEVAEALGMTRGLLSNYKSRNVIPFEAIANFCIDKNISFDWLVLDRQDAGTLALDIDNLKAVNATLQDKIKSLEDMLAVMDYFREAGETNKTLPKLDKLKDFFDKRRKK